MTKTRVITGMLVVGFTTLSANASDVSSKVTEYCATAFYEYSHSIEIGEVTGVATHRNGFLQVTESSNEPELKQALMRNSSLLTNPSDCLTYISNLGIAQFSGEVGDKGRLIARVHFAFDRFNLTPLAREVLSGVARQLALSNYRVTVEGHTDWIGTEAYNQGLGFDRAKSTASELVKYRVKRENTELKSFGESEPVATNETSQGRSKNRRADVYIPANEQE
ncbi:OmpA family protein [Vibrio sp.]|uniref:OmpA family protein n=1 Tax=Vibrio sp. TaxID=678 RepID=UPI003AA98A21